MLQQILIVDDDVDVVRFLSRRLQLAGYAVLSAHDGITGEAAACAHSPDLILLDMRMPGRDGLATLTALRRTPETEAIPIVMLSGVGSDGDAALAAGADRVLLKPCGRDELLQTIAGLLNRSNPLNLKSQRFAQPAQPAGFPV